MLSFLSLFELASASDCFLKSLDYYFLGHSPVVVEEEKRSLNAAMGGRPFGAHFPEGVEQMFLVRPDLFGEEDGARGGLPIGKMDGTHCTDPVIGNHARLYPSALLNDVEGEPKAFL
jgi:hypothetical protein